MKKKGMLRAITTFPLIIILSFLSSCGAKAKVTYQPPFTPISFSIDTTGTISIQGDGSVETPVGIFSISTNVFTQLQPEDNVLILVIRHKENDSIVDTEYEIQTGQDDVKVVTNGSTTVEVTLQKVFIDASNGDIQTIEVKGDNPSSTAPLTCNRVNWTDNQPINDISSSLSPALAVFHGTLYMAFIDTNNSNNIAIVSSQDGVNWTRNLYVGSTGSTPPALAVFNDTLYLAFAENLTLQIISSKDGRTWTSPQAVGQYAANAPALAVLNNTLYLVFSTIDPVADDLLLISSTDGVNWTNHQPISGTTSSLSPTLVVLNNTLYLAFVEDNNNDLLIVSSTDGANWTGSQEVGQFSSATPTLVTWNNSLCLTFATNDSGHNLLTISSTDSVNWTDNQTVGQSSWATPALALWNNTLYMAFIANDSSNDLLLVKGW